VNWHNCSNCACYIHAFSANIGYVNITKRDHFLQSHARGLSMANNFRESISLLRFLRRVEVEVCERRTNRLKRLNRSQRQQGREERGGRGPEVPRGASRCFVFFVVGLQRTLKPPWVARCLDREHLIIATQVHARARSFITHDASQNSSPGDHSSVYELNFPCGISPA